MKTNGRAEARGSLGCGSRGSGERVVSACSRHMLDTPRGDSREGSWIREHDSLCPIGRGQCVLWVDGRVVETAELTVFGLVETVLRRFRDSTCL